MKGVNLGLKVMKRLFAVFLVLGALMSVEAWAKTEDLQKGGVIENWVNSKMKQGASAIGTAYSAVLSLAQDTTMALVGRTYKGISRIYNNVISVLLGLIAFFWLFKHLKSGGNIPKEEIFKALTWVIVFVIVYVLLNSRAAYDGVAQLFFYPQKILSSIFGGQANVETTMIKTFGEPMIKLFKSTFSIYGDFTEKVGLWKTQYIIGIPITQAIMSIYVLYLFIALAISIAVAIIHLYSTFLAGIYLTFLPIIISLIPIPQTKAMFGAWVKAFIGITAYIPLSNIALNILNANPAKLNFSKDQIDTIMQSVLIYSLTGILLGIASICILFKIPTWTSELLGVANQGVGAGGVIGMVKTGADGLSKATMSKISPLGNIARAATNSSGNIASSGLSALSGGTINPNAINTAGRLGGQVLKDVYKLAKAGFNAMGKHYSNFSKK